MNLSNSFPFSLYLLGSRKRVKEKDRATEFIEKREKIARNNRPDERLDISKNSVYVSTKGSSLHMSYISYVHADLFFPRGKRELVSLALSLRTCVCIYVCVNVYVRALYICKFLYFPYACAQRYSYKTKARVM